MHWFYIQETKEKLIHLPQAESNHCAKVLRLKSGDKVYITNGKGSLFECTIIDAHSKRTVVEIQTEYPNYQQRNYKIHLAVSLTKSNDRYEWFLEKATEIGIDSISPIICFHSERRKMNMDRYNKVLESAMKQSYKAFHPKLNPPINFSMFIEENKEKENKYIAHCLESEKYPFFEKIEQGTELLVLIGPEGGFSKEELNLAIESGYIPVDLGNTRLRTETAAIVACTMASIKNQ